MSPRLTKNRRRFLPVHVPKIRRIVDDVSRLGERIKLFGRWPVTELDDGAKRDGDGSGLVGSLLTVA